MLTASVHFATGKPLFKHWYDRNDTPTRPKDEKGPARRGPKGDRLGDTGHTSGARKGRQRWYTRGFGLPPGRAPPNGTWRPRSAGAP